MDIELEHQAPDRRGASVTDIEVIDLAPDPSIPPDPANATRSKKGWVLWILVASMVVGGIALLPGADAGPTPVKVESLPDPVAATTTTIAARASVAVMSQESFLLIPVPDLTGFVQLAGPIEFDGRDWIAGNRQRPATEVEILSSRDGTTWSRDSAIGVGDGMWLRIDDLEVYNDMLVAVGTVGLETGPSFARSDAGTITLWTSIDGISWSAQVIETDIGKQNSSLSLTTSPEEVLVTGYQSKGLDPSALAAIPAELLPGLEAGDFSLTSDFANIRVIAPPGIEVFTWPFERGIDSSGEVLFRSADLTSWETVPVSSFSIWSIAATLDGGFVANANLSQVVYSADGRTWDRTDRFPNRFFQTRGGRMIGVDFGSQAQLAIIDENGLTTIALPSELDSVPAWFTPGEAGVATTIADYPEFFGEPSAQIDGYSLEMDNGILRIRQAPGETTSSVFAMTGLIDGSYVVETDSVRFSSNDGSRVFEFPLAGLQQLRYVSQPARFDIALSEDGLVWAKSQTGLLTDQALIVGGVGDGFLIADTKHGPFSRSVANFTDNQSQSPLTIYRTGPVG